MRMCFDPVCFFSYLTFWDLKNIACTKKRKEPSCRKAGGLPVCSLSTYIRIHIRIVGQLIEMLDIFQWIEGQLI